MLSCARAQRAQGALEERLARIGGGRQRDQRRQPMEEVARLRRDVGQLPDHTDTDSSMMFIAAKPATARHLRQPARVARFLGLGAFRLERMRAIADVLQRRDHVAGRELVLAPVDREPPVGEVEPRVDDAGQLLQAAFDLADAGRAVDALDREVHVRACRRGAARRSKDRASRPWRAPQCRTTRLRERNSALAAARQLDDHIPLAGDRRRRRRGSARPRPRCSATA